METCWNPTFKNVSFYRKKHLYTSSFNIINPYDYFSLKKGFD